MVGKTRRYRPLDTLKWYMPAFFEQAMPWLCVIFTLPLSGYGPVRRRASTSTFRRSRHNILCIKYIFNKDMYAV